MRLFPLSRRAATSAVLVASSVLYVRAASAGTALEGFTNSINGTATGAGIKSGQSDLASLVGSVIGSLLGILGIVLVGYIIYGGYTWMTAQGDDKKVDRAKQIIKNAVIGMVLIFASYAIVNTALVLISRSQTPDAEADGVITDDELLNP